jgi:topoisomerase IA-like protein
MKKRSAKPKRATVCLTMTPAQLQQALLSAGAGCGCSVKKATKKKATRKKATKKKATKRKATRKKAARKPKRPQRDRNGRFKVRGR